MSSQTTRSSPRATLAVTRQWVSGAIRRPVRAITIVIGVAVMSAATVGALVGGDVLETLFIADAEAEWGEVDVEVRADDNAVHELSTGRLLAEEGLPAVDAAVPRLILEAAVTGGATTEPGVQLLGLGAEEQLLEPLEAVEGSAEFLLLDPDEVILNERLAERLDAGVGDEVTVTAAVPRWLEDVPRRQDPVIHQPFAVQLELTVAGVVADTGVADLHRTPNALMRRDRLGRATELDNRVTVTHLRAADRSPDGVDAAIDALAHLVAPFELDVEPVRLDTIALADDDGGLFRSILLTLSIIVVAAAAVATRGLLITLAEERGRELAVLRAVGLRQRRAGWLLRGEAIAYGVVGAALGGLVGGPLGNGMARLLADHFASLSAGRGREQVALVPDVDPVTVATGVVIVLVVVLLAAGSAAKLVLRAPIGEVLRGGFLDPPPPKPSPRRATLSVAGGAFLLGMGATGGGPLVFIGLTVLLGGWWLRARAADPANRDAIDRRAAWWGVAWSLVGSALLGDPAAGVQSAFGVLIVGGAALILCASVLLRPRLRQLTRLIRTWAPLGRLQAALIVAGAGAERTRQRSTTTMVTMGTVLFMVAALSVLGSAQALPVQRQSGGFDVIARSIGRIDARQLQRRDDVAAAAAVSEAWLPQPAYWAEGEDRTPLTVPYPVRVAETSGTLASTQAFGLADAIDGVETAGQALAAVSARQGAAVVDRAGLPEGAAVGDDIVIDQGIAPRRLRLLAVLDTYLLSTVFLHPGDLARVAQLTEPDMALIRAADGVDPGQLAAALEAEHRAIGLTADPVERVRQDVIAVNRTFTDTFAVLLVLGLVVAVVTVAAHVVRVARERRAQLGVLRALGLRRSSVRLSLAAEPAVAAIVGAVLGLVAGLGLLRALFALGFSDLAFVVDWARVGVVAGGALLLLVLACGAAAAIGAPRRVGEALRDMG